MKVLEWGYDLIDGQMHSKVVLWGCTKCDITSPEVLYDMEENNKSKEDDHSNCDNDPCFGCKAKGLQLSTGDANSKVTMASKKFNKELDAYKDARKQGIQPSGTSMAKINAALKASETLGKAYNGNTMPSAEKITPQIAKVMKEVGQ